jgi:hypothetical protein
VPPDVKGPTDCTPLTALVPAHAPEAEQAVALVEDQVREEEPPLLTVLGLALNVTVGAASATETVVDCAAWPPGPMQVIVYVELLESGPTDFEPLTPSSPDQAPEATHPVVF